MQIAEKETISTVRKGDVLEDAFYEYLVEQKKSGKLIDGLYKPELCEIYKKKGYYCRDREADVQFDIVIEVKRENAEGFALVIVFECKNYEGNVPEKEGREFSDKLKGIFIHNIKGALVCASKLQSGAMKLIENRGLALIKYDKHGFEYIVQRQAKDLIDSGYIKNNLFQGADYYKSIKFSAYCEGCYYSSFANLVCGLLSDDPSSKATNQSASLPYISQKDMELRTARLLSDIYYQDGAVDLFKVCDVLSLKLEYMEETSIDGNGNEVLGEADFEKRCIKIYPHKNKNKNKNRERFTIAHEIGHFYLKHSEFLSSESVIENDLFIGDISDAGNFYRNMEFQANTFASCLLLPAKVLIYKIFEVKSQYEIPTSRYGIYVDDQPCNFKDYNLLMSELVVSFEVSKTAIEFRLRKLNFLIDNRK